MTRTGLRIAVLSVILGTMGCDFATKHAAASFLQGEPSQSYLGDSVLLTYAENDGGMLSLGANLPPRVRATVFLVFTGVLLGGLVVYAFRREWTRVGLIGVTLFIAGGASNWIDRVLGDGVVDFLVIGVGPVRTGVFNVADVAIFAGAALFMVGEYRDRDAALADAPADAGAEHDQA